MLFNILILTAPPDLEASRLGIPRQAIIKLWLSERLKSASDENGTDQHPVA